MTGPTQGEKGEREREGRGEEENELNDGELKTGMVSRE